MFRNLTDLTELGTEVTWYLHRQRLARTSGEVADLTRLDPRGSVSRNRTGSGAGLWSLSPILEKRESIPSGEGGVAAALLANWKPTSAK